MSRVTLSRDQQALVLLIALFCLLAALHSVVVPLFEAPDEIWHFSFIEVLAREHVLPVQPADQKDMWLRESGQPPLYHVTSALLVLPFDTGDFPDFVRFNVAHPAIDQASESDAPNVFIHTPYEVFPYRGSVLVVHLLRLLTALWGAGAVVGVYYVASEIAPRRGGLAVAAAGVVALNPHFVFISSVINNDATAACLCTWVLWLCIGLGKGKLGPRGIAALGGMLGLALLSKVSALALLPLVGLALALAWWRDRLWRELLVRGAVVFGLSFLVAGWWYVRNWVLYGDPLGWDIWLQDIGLKPVSFDELLRQFGHVFTSFWSPADGLFPEPVLVALGVLLAGAAVGLGVLIWQRDRRVALSAEGLIVSGAWLVLLFASLVRYMSTTPSAEGRLLFPGIASFATFLVVGWDAVIPRRWQPATVGVVGGGLLALAVASPLFAIVPRYALPLVDPRRLSTDLEPALETWHDVDLLGVDVEPETFSSGDVVRVSVYWRAEVAPEADLRAVVQIWSAGGRLLVHSDQVPAGESYPPDLWRTGDIVRDVRRLHVQATGPAACKVVVALRDGDDIVGEYATPPIYKLAPPPLAEDELPDDGGYRFGDVAELIGISVPDSANPTTEELPVTLYWRVLSEMDESYTVFVHLVGADGQILGQGDGPPAMGDYPTTSWEPGETLADTHVVTLGDPLPAGSYLLVGLYRLDDGTRLPAFTDTGERVLHDAVRLDLE